MTTLVIAEHKDGVLAESTKRAAAAACEIGESWDGAVLGEPGCEVVAQALAALPGARKVYCAAASFYDHQSPEPIAERLLTLVDEQGYSTVLMAATSDGKDLLPRLAGLLDVGMVSDVTEILGEHRFTRPIYAGNALETVRALDNPCVLTVRPTAFKPLEHAAEPNGEVVTLAAGEHTLRARFVEESLTVSDRPELTSAKVVVSGGRGVGSAEGFESLATFADEIGAALGASRAAVDASFVPNDYQVGQTGKVVAPEIYIAFGISGAIQHMAGMKDSRVIVAINKDTDAPIFEVADYGLVGDLFEVLPELRRVLREAG
mgnify:CR=1 FL=1